MTSWSLLSPYLIRAAGFSFARLEPLRCLDAARAERALADTAAERQAAGHALDAALGAERYAGNPAFDDPAVRKILSGHVKRARTFARRGDSPGEPPHEALAEVARVVPTVTALVERLRSAHAHWITARATYVAAFADDFARARGAIRALYRDRRLQESVFLESSEAYERIQQLIATDGPRNARARQRERLAALYAQRFCAKNDTNSICGPHGVAYLGASSAHAPSVAAPPVMINIVREDARRQTYFSHWAAERVLDAAVRRAGHDPTFRMHPSAHLDGDVLAWCVMEHDATTAFRRRYRKSQLPPAGVRLVGELASPKPLSTLVALAPELDLDADDLVEYLEQLVEGGVVLRGPHLAPGLFTPLTAVAAELARWPMSEDRVWAEGEVTALAQHVSAFATGSLDERLAIYEALRRRFVEATGDAATRGEGQHYADRSLLHEDCFVDVATELSTAQASIERVLPVLFAALELPLELARERVREWFRARFGEATVPALEVHRAFDEDNVLSTQPATPRADQIRRAITRVRDAIAHATTTDTNQPSIHLTVDDLERALAELPASTQPAYVSADVMLRRDAGTISLVLGEVHGFFWLPTSLLDVLPPEDRDRTVAEMRAAVRAMAGEAITAECVFLHTQATDRRFALASTDLQLMIPSDREGAIDLGSLDLVLAGDTFTFSHRGTEVVPMVAYTNYPFILYTSRIAPVFDSYAERFFPDSLLPQAMREQDAPRIAIVSARAPGRAAIDDIVVRRRLWRRTAGALRDALAAPDEAELFRKAQILQRSLGCEARVFVSASNEPKPILLDFSNVFLLEAFVNMLEREPADAVVKIGEMLPGPAELVARGPDGERTCELRIGFYRVTSTTAAR